MRNRSKSATCRRPRRAVSVWSGVRRGVVAAATALVSLGLGAPVAVAQVNADPTSAGMPAGALVSKLVGWLMWLGLMACLGTIVYGAAMWRGGARSGNTMRAEDGKQYVMGGAIGSLITGAAVTIVNTLFSAGKAG
jgi:hypothetical protein